MSRPEKYKAKGSGSYTDPARAPCDLGEQWWVLDTALRLYRELGQKKGRELLLLKELKTHYHAFPEGLTYATESPDFTVQTPQGPTVGLELVEVYRDAARRKGSPQRERQSAQEDVVRLAEEFYYAGNCPVPVYAALTWPPAFERLSIGPLPHPTDDLGAEVARLVAQAAPTVIGGERRELRQDDVKGSLLEGLVRSISVRQTGYIDEQGRDSKWGQSSSHGVAEAGTDDLEHAIAGKDRVHARCREKCDEVWLVAALTGGPASFEDATHAATVNTFRSKFDKVILLCPSSRVARRTLALPLAQ